MAQAIIDEINDFLEIIDSKFEKTQKNLDRAENCNSQVEKKKLLASSQREVDKISNDLKSL